MTFYIIMALVTLVILLFHFLNPTNWEEYKGTMGDTGVKIMATIAFTVGLAAWPISLMLLAIRMVIKSKSTTVGTDS